MKPYDRPLNRLNAFKRRPFLGHSRATNPDKGEQELPKVPVEQQVREIVPTTNINLEDLHKRVGKFQSRAGETPFANVGIID